MICKERLKRKEWERQNACSNHVRVDTGKGEGEQKGLSALQELGSEGDDLDSRPQFMVDSLRILNWRIIGIHCRFIENNSTISKETFAGICRLFHQSNKVTLLSHFWQFPCCLQNLSSKSFIKFGIC